MANRNPDWTEEEIILACDLVAQNGWRAIPDRDPRVIELSELSPAELRDLVGGRANHMPNAMSELNSLLHRKMQLPCLIKLQISASNSMEKCSLPRPT